MRQLELHKRAIDNTTYSLLYSSVAPPAVYHGLYPPRRAADAPGGAPAPQRPRPQRRDPWAWRATRVMYPSFMLEYRSLSNRRRR
jgi:hypothetical protein